MNSSDSGCMHTCIDLLVLSLYIIIIIIIINIIVVVVVVVVVIINAIDYRHLSSFCAIDYL